MIKLTPEEEKQKQAIYDQMSPRARKRIDRIGYDKWDPFQKPKDPIDIRTDGLERTAQSLVVEFMKTAGPKNPSPIYKQGVMEVCLGLFNRDDRSLGQFEFCAWYKEKLAAAGIDGPFGDD